MPGIEVPYKKLTPEALDGLIEEFVSREGTDYGHSEVSFDRKAAAVMRQLETGRAVVLYDPDAGTCNIATREEFSRSR